MHITHCTNEMHRNLDSCTSQLDRGRLGPTWGLHLGTHGPARVKGGSFAVLRVGYLLTFLTMGLAY
jgi:hypothetical protein